MIVYGYCANLLGYGEQCFLKISYNLYTFANSFHIIFP